MKPSFRAFFLGLAAIGLAACAHEPRDGTAATPSGASLYRVSCAACHGPQAHGDGPVAPLLAVPVPDLTRIAARRNGEFPELEIFRIVDGQAERSGQKPRHMPIWGYEFFDPNVDDAAAHRQASEQVDRLVDYLRSIQSPR